MQHYTGIALVYFPPVMRFLSTSALVDIQNSVTRNSNGLYAMQSRLYLAVVKEDKDAYFYCEVTYFVPGAEKMIESNRVNITVHCEPFLSDFFQCVQSTLNELFVHDITVQLYH